MTDVATSRCPMWPWMLAGLIMSAFSEGCAEARFDFPMTAADLASDASGRSLVAYLGQRDASPAVCDARAAGPHVQHLDDEGQKALVSGLVDGRVQPELWERCAKAIMRSAWFDERASFLDAVGHAYRKTLVSDDLETRPVVQARMRAMQALYLERKTGTAGHSDVLGPMFDDLREALADHRLGPVATRFGQDLLTTVDLERGLWNGVPVTIATLDSLANDKNDAALGLFVQRLPSEALRNEAKRRSIRLHIAASPFPEVRDHADAVEDALMRFGRNPISIAEHPATSGRIDSTKLPMPGVVVRQHVWQQTATMLGERSGVQAISILPEVKLRGALFVSSEGLSHEITVCGPSRALDPSPCVSAEDVRLENPLAYLDRGGAFHLVDRIGMGQAIDFAKRKDEFAMPVTIGGRRVATLQWQLSFERPDDLLFTGSMPGANGPDVGVSASPTESGRLVFSVSSAGGTYLAALEGADAPSYRIGSVGAAGESGASGEQGASGPSGSECQSGGNGGPGGDGGPGGPGGNGGNVYVVVTCGGQPCDETIDVMHSVAVSRGGPGGAGGSGGAGGPGGSGGPAGASTTSTDADGNTTTTPGCSAGSDGSAGSSGADGADGPDGRGGRVVVRAER